jgi:hypothetical protein
MRRLTVFAFAVVCVAACSSGSTGPRLANVSGYWSGVDQGGPGCPTDTVSVALSQSDTNLTGTWGFSDCDGGQIGGGVYGGGTVKGDSVSFGTGWGDFHGTVSGNTITDSTFYNDGLPLVLTRQ